MRTAPSLKKILVIQQKMIGDVLASTVICSALKRAFPESEIHYMIHKNTVAVVQNNPDVDKIIEVDPSKTGIKSLIDLGHRLRAERYDAIIDAYGKWESLIPAVISGAKIRIGQKKWYTSLFYSKTIVPTQNISGSAIYHRLELAEALTGKFDDITFPQIHLSGTEISAAKSLISSAADVNKPIVMISVLGSGKNKSLPSKQMAKVLDMISECGDLQMIFNFMPTQKDEAMAIYNAALPETRTKILFDLYTKSLREFLAVLSLSDALIGNEGGAVNMAKALNIPTFTIFSPWINKSSWNMLEDDARHAAVHLNDFHPEIYEGKHSKEFKSEAENLYKKLDPEIFRTKLQSFVKRII